MITLWKVILVISTFFWTSIGIERKDIKREYSFMDQKICEEFVFKQKETAKNVRDSNSFNRNQPRVYVEGKCLPSVENLKINPGYII